MEMWEEFISGFCRTCNGSQTVCCEFIRENETVYIDNMDCAHKRCIHHGACEIYKEAHRIGKDRDL